MIQREWTPEDYIAMLRRYWFVIIVLAGVGAGIAYGYSRTLPNRYTSHTSVLVEQPTVPTDFVRPIVTTEISERLISMQQQVLSQPRLEPLIQQLGLFPEDSNRLPMQALVARLQSAITVIPMRPADDGSPHVPGFYIDVTLGDAQTAQTVCATVASMFIAENLRVREEHSADTTEFLDQQLSDSKAKLDQQDAKLAAFKSQHIGFLPDEEQANLNMLSNLTSQLDATTQALSRAQQDKSTAEANLTQQLAAWRASQTGHNPDTYEEQLAVLQTQLADLQGRYTDSHPDVIKTKIQIEALKKKIVESEEQNRALSADQSSTEPSQFKQLRAQIVSYDQSIAERTAQQAKIQEQIKSYQARIQSSPNIEQEYKELTRDYQTALDIYNDLMRKRSQSTMAADLEHHQEAEQFRVLDPANLPGAPSYPNRPYFALGGLGGGMALGLGLAFYLELRDTTLRTEKDVEHSLELPVLAMVPVVKSMRVSKTKSFRREPARSDMQWSLKN